MTMLSAQPITLTGEQHDRLWKQAKELRNLSLDIIQSDGRLRGATALTLTKLAASIERILIDAQDAAPPATASSGEAA